MTALPDPTQAEDRPDHKQAEGGPDLTQAQGGPDLTQAQGGPDLTQADGRPVLAPVRLALGAISAFLLMALMAVTVVDVAGRYLFASPLSGASELTELLLAAVVFCGLPAVCLDDGHVTVDLLTSRLAGRAHAVQLALIRLVTVVALALIGWRLAVVGTRAASTGEVTPYLRLPVHPTAYAAAALCAVAALLTLALVAMRARQGGIRPVRAPAD